VKTSQAALGGAAVLVVVVYAAVAARVTAQNSDWYASLPRPWFQPPDLVFGVIWPYNFAALALTGVVLAVRTTSATAGTWVAVLAGSAAAALTWLYLFYVPHVLLPAAAVLAVGAAAAWLLVALAARAVPWTGLVVLPYAVWLSVATALAFAYARTPTA